MAACDSKEPVGILEAVNSVGRLGTCAIRFLSPPGSGGGGKGPNLAIGLDVLAGDGVAELEDEDEEVLAAALAAAFAS